MSGIAWLMLGLAALVALAMVPGVQHAVKPLVGSLFKLVEFLAENVWKWFVWYLKSVMDAHINVYRHLTHTADDIDPSRKIEK